MPDTRTLYLIQEPDDASLELMLDDVRCQWGLDELCSASGVAEHSPTRYAPTEVPCSVLAYYEALQALFARWRRGQDRPASREMYDAVLDEILRVDRVLYPSYWAHRPHR